VELLFIKKMEAKSNNNSGLYWAIGISVVAVGGYFVYQNFYNQNIKDNKLVKAYNWVSSIF